MASSKKDIKKKILGSLPVNEMNVLATVQGFAELNPELDSSGIAWHPPISVESSELTAIEIKFSKKFMADGHLVVYFAGSEGQSVSYSNICLRYLDLSDLVDQLTLAIKICGNIFKKKGQPKCVPSIPF
jgi:hypothetical protein